MKNAFSEEGIRIGTLVSGLQKDPADYIRQILPYGFESFSITFWQTTGGKDLKKIFHVHGKDATILWDVVREYGVHGSKQFAFHRTPGFGDSNWTDIISELRRGGFSGAIDIEGWHDPVCRGELEMTGQVHALNHLKNCRGGTFIPNPV